MVIPLKGKVVTAKEVLACGPQPTPKMETVIVTLMHLALHSEKIELEVIFLLAEISNLFKLHLPDRVYKSLHFKGLIDVTCAGCFHDVRDFCH